MELSIFCLSDLCSCDEIHLLLQEEVRVGGSDLEQLCHYVVEQVLPFAFAGQIAHLCKDSFSHNHI